MTPAEIRSLYVETPAIPRAWTTEHALPIISPLAQFPRWRYLGPVASRLESGRSYVAAAGTPQLGVSE